MVRVDVCPPVVLSKFGVLSANLQSPIVKFRRVVPNFDFHFHRWKKCRKIVETVQDGIFKVSTISICHSLCYFWTILGWTSQSRLRAHVMGVNSYQYRPTRVVWNAGQRRWLPPVTVVQFSDGVGVSSSCRLHKNERKAFSILISWSRGITGCTVEFRKKR